ncbi:MAG: hypothetical protein AAFO29_02245 [Actinomycetota bacterium]
MTSTDRAGARRRSSRVLVIGIGLAGAMVLAAARSTPPGDRAGSDRTKASDQVTAGVTEVNRLDSYLLDDPVAGSGLGPTRAIEAIRTELEPNTGLVGSDRPINTRSRSRVVF